jgi:hypothetical protein
MKMGVGISPRRVRKVAARAAPWTASTVKWGLKTKKRPVGKNAFPAGRWLKVIF